MKLRLTPVPVMTAVVTATTFALYVSTMAPGITWSSLGADGGDLLTAAFTWGIPHPSGYPTYLLVLRAFAAVVPLGDPAFRGNLMSATLAALATGLVFVAAARMATTPFGSPGTRAQAHPRGPRGRLPPRHESLQKSPVPEWIPVGAAAVAALGAGTARELWSQATITEVYALNAFFVAVIVGGSAVLLVRRNDNPADRWILAGLAFAFGLGLGNHLTLALAAGPVLGVVLADRWKRHGRRIGYLVPALLLFFAGLAVYAYAPLASIQRPPLNWGHPHTPQGFWWMISGSIYRDYAFGLETRLLPGRVATWADFFLAQYSVAGLWLGLTGLYVLWKRSREFAASSAIAVGLVSFYAIGYNTPDSFLYLIPAFLIFAIWIAAGITWVMVEIHRFFTSRRWPEALFLKSLLVGASLLAIAGAISGFSLYSNMGTLNLRQDHAARDFANGAIETAGSDSVILASDTERVFALWYQAYVAEPQSRIAVVSIPHLQFDWYWDDLRRQFPERVPDGPPRSFNARVDALIGHNVGVRPVYAASRTTTLDRYTLTAEGVLFEIEGLR